MTWQVNVPPVTWVVRRQLMGPPHHWAMLGPVRVATIIMPIQKRDEEPVYEFKLQLPGLKPEHVQGRKPLLDDCKKVAEDKIKLWFRAIQSKVETA